MKGWYGDKLRHRLASRGILTTIENRGEGWGYGGLNIHDKKWLGKNAEYQFIELLKRNTDYTVINVSELNKGLGDIQVEIRTECGDCIALLEVKNIESIHKDKVGTIAIKPRYHMELLRNAEELGAVPIYILKVNEDMGDGIFENVWYWKRAELFTEGTKDKKWWYLPRLDEGGLAGAEPIDDLFEFLELECDRRMCDG